MIMNYDLLKCSNPALILAVTRTVLRGGERPPLQSEVCPLPQTKFLLTVIGHLG